MPLDTNFDFRWSLLVPLAGLLTACGGGDSGPAPAATPVLSITGAPSGGIVRTVAATLNIAGSALPTSGLRVTVPGDAKASCQTPTQMSAGGFKVACQFNQIGTQALEIRSATQLLGTASVTVKSNVTGVSWTSPSTDTSGAVKFGETVTFKVSGVNLLADTAMNFAVDKCDSPTETGTASNTLRTFACTFTNSAGAVAGQMPGVVKDSPGGQALLDGWKVDVQIAPVEKLTDTGITASQCYAAGRNTLVSCTSAAAIALNDKQDGMVGRDVSTPGAADGKLGFSYSTVGSYAKTECVKDNITGLTWEGKPTSGPRAASNLYPNNGDNSAGDASAYVAAVNAAKLCGYSDWRLPSADELEGIVDYSDVEPGRTIDGTWFPNTQYEYWTSTASVDDSSDAWVVNFGSGYSKVSFGRDERLYVRLVR